MSTDSRIKDLAVRVATECKSLRMMINGNLTDLSTLSTTANTTLVGSINEITARITAMTTAMASMINDATNDATHSWSSSKISSELLVLKNEITSDAASTMASLNTINAALANEGNQVTAAIASAIAAMVRFDAAQQLTAEQQARVLANIGAVSAAAIGSTDTNYVAIFNTGLLP